MSQLVTDTEYVLPQRTMVWMHPDVVGALDAFILIAQPIAVAKLTRTAVVNAILRKYLTVEMERYEAMVKEAK